MVCNFTVRNVNGVDVGERGKIGERQKAVNVGWIQALVTESDLKVENGFGFRLL